MTGAAPERATDWRLEPLGARHRDALLRFERANRAWFARSVPDRGDDYFADFDARLHVLLAEHRAGTGWYSVVVAPDGEVLARVNLADVADGSAWLGYRVAETAAGQGVVSGAVAEVLAVAREQLRVRTVVAMTRSDNVASQAVLQRNGFRRVAETSATGELRYEKVLQ